jgi:hypothetical protein
MITMPEPPLPPIAELLIYAVPPPPVFVAPLDNVSVDAPPAEYVTDDPEIDDALPVPEAEPAPPPGTLDEADVGR